MKITQSDKQLVVKQGGVSQLIASIVFIILGVGLAVLLFGGDLKNNGHKSSPLLGLIGVALALIGILMMVFAQKKQTTIQKGGDTTIVATRLIGGKSANQSFPTANIVSVRLSTYLQASGNNNGGVGFNAGNSSSGRQSDLSLVLNNNDLVQLGSGSSSGGASINGINVSNLVQHAPLSKEANQIAGFLGVPLDAQDNTSVVGEVRSVVDAFHQATNKDDTQPANSTPTITGQAVQPSEPTSPAPQPPTTPPIPPTTQPPAEVPPTPPPTGQPPAI